jgi:hypothetical protein
MGVVILRQDHEDVEGDPLVAPLRISTIVTSSTIRRHNDAGEKKDTHRGDDRGGRPHMAFGGSALAGTILTATMTGAEVVPPGDPNGTGTARLGLMPNREQICYRITVSNIKPDTAAHIHKAPAGQTGAIVKELKAPSDGSSRGCVRLSSSKIMNIKNNPSGYYVNVHNRPYPDGAVRGQLSAGS